MNKQNLIDKFPYPQISRAFKRLSNGDIVSPLNNIDDMNKKIKQKKCKERYIKVNKNHER